MTKEELVEFLKENLRVVTDRKDGYVEVKLYLDGELVSSDSVRVDY